VRATITAYVTRDWADIVFYRDFHDVPRLFAFRVGARCVVLDSPFRDDLDDYAAHYVIRVLDVPSTDPSEIIARASAVEAVGEVAVTAVELDPTRRERVRISGELALRLEHGRIPGGDA
jgi:hypothetical protein